MKSRGRNHRPLALLCLLLLAAPAGAARAQGPAAKRGALRASPSAFRLLASGVAYAGVEEFAGADDESVEWRRENLKPIVVGGSAYHVAHMVPGLDLEGLAEEDTATGAWTVYPLFHLAVAAGWYRPEEGDNNHPDAANGLARAGDLLWMGSNGVGVIVFDTRRRLWSRHDLKEEPREGRHTTLWHADEDYVFATAGEFPGASMHVYSARRGRWLRLDAVPTADVRRYGRTGPMTQVTVDHSSHASEKYLPVDWSVAMLDRVTPLEGGGGYLFEKKFTEDSSTVFAVAVGQLEEAFDRLPAADK